MKKILLGIPLFLIIILHPLSVSADHLGTGEVCGKSGLHCNKDNQCVFRPSSGEFQCTRIPPNSSTAIFGKIELPQALDNLGFGSIGISSFANALIRLIYMLAAVIFVFMLLWGAIEWLMSGGDKEKVGSAQKRLTNAIIGIILLGVTFAILDLIGIFTGFTFFN